MLRNLKGQSRASILVGKGLIKLKGWARIWGIYLGILNLINFPFGTVLGIFSLFVLLNHTTIRLFNEADLIKKQPGKDKLESDNRRPNTRQHQALRRAPLATVTVLILLILILSLALVFSRRNPSNLQTAEEAWGSWIEIPLTGDPTKVPRAKKDAGTEIEIAGTFFFDFDGKEYDALYTADSTGLWSLQHSFLSWPAGLEPVSRAFEPSHTYRFQVQPGYDFTGQGITFRIDIDVLVDTFIIPPSEVRVNLRPGSVPLRVRSRQP